MRNQRIGYLVGILLIGVLTWSVILFEYSFIPSRVLTVSCIASSVAAIIIYYNLWKSTSSIWFIIFFGLLTGISLSLLIIIIPNHFTREEKTIETTLYIISKGKTKRSKAICWRPYAKVDYEGVTRKINFSCDYKSEVAVARSIKLVMTKGCWGFYVIVDKQLVR